MGHSRRMPPLFEVMSETNERLSPPPKKLGAVTPVVGPPTTERVSGPEPSSRASGVFPRITTPAPDREASIPPPDADNDDAGPIFGRRLAISMNGLWVLLAVLIAGGILLAYLAYSAGREDEKTVLLGNNRGGPPDLSKQDGSSLIHESADQSNNTPQDSARPPVGNGGDSTPPPQPSSASVFGDDPRVAGSNYLVVETLMYKDAEAAARYLTDNGVPSVIVAPEGSDVAKRREEPRATWWVIVREGIPGSEWKASKAKADALLTKVKQLGRRWKQDHKGVSDFSGCLWNKFQKK